MNTVTAAALYARNAAPLLSSGARAPAAAATAPGSGNADTAGPSAGADISVILDLSVTAQAAMAAPPAVASGGYDAQFFPTRDGFSSSALAAAVTDPGAESFSGGKTLAEVGTAARASMDANYAAMNASGKPFDFNSMEGADWYSLMGNLDRRAVYAVSSNQGGQFTQQEQDIAQSIMSQQQGLAMGLYAGPTRLEGNFADPYAGDNAARFGASAHWLDGVSNDEKSSVAWAFNRASVQTAYESNAGGDGKPVEDLDSENPLVKLIRTAMATMRDDMSRDHTHGRVDTPDDLKAQPWFEGFGDGLDAAIAQTKALYGIGA